MGCGARAAAYAPGDRRAAGPDVRGDGVPSTAPADRSPERRMPVYGGDPAVEEEVDPAGAGRCDRYAPAPMPPARDAQPRLGRGRQTPDRQMFDQPAVLGEGGLLRVVVVHQPVLLLEVLRGRVGVAQVEPAVVRHVVGAAKIVHRADHRVHRLDLARLGAAGAGRVTVLLDL